MFSEIGNEINCMDINCWKTTYATAGKDLTVRIYDRDTFTVRFRFTILHVMPYLQCYTGQLYV